MNSIYKKYKERLIEISGKNRSLYAKKIGRQYAYDIGKILHFFISPVLGTAANLS